MVIKDRNYLYIALASMALFFPFLGVVHLFDWDEINFAESAREMIVTGDYLRVRIDFQPFWEKPPLFFWLQVLSMKLFGINEFAARFPNAVFGVITLLTLYAIGKRQHDQKFALTWVFMFGGALLPFFYFKSGIIDPVFNYFIFLSIYFLYRASFESESRLRNSALAGLFNGLAVLTKGPVGLLLMLLTWIIIQIYQRFRQLPSLGQVLLFILTWASVTFFWYGFEMISNGPWFLVEFIKYQIDLFVNPVAGHEQPLFYHFVVVFLGCFPFSVLALPAFRKSFLIYDPFRQWMKVLFWTVMILFTIVTTKIVHYSSMAYIPLSYVAASSVHFRFQLKPFSRAITITYLITGILLSLLFTALPLVIMFKDKLIPYIKDEFTRDSLSVNVEMMGWEWLIGLAYLSVVIYGFLYLRKDITRAVRSISLGTALFLWAVMAFMVPKVERFSQGPEIRFFESLAGQDVYVKNIGFKSYAQYFYFRQPEQTNENRLDRNWLLFGDIDKPVYFVTKSNKKELDQYSHIEFLRQEGGYKLYLRKVGSFPKSSSE